MTDEQKEESVLVNKSLLIELKNGIIEAIATFDGLDGSDGMYLLSRINDLLGLPLDSVDYKVACE